MTGYITNSPHLPMITSFSFVKPQELCMRIAEEMVLQTVRLRGCGNAGVFYQPLGDPRRIPLPIYNGRGLLNFPVHEGDVLWAVATRVTGCSGLRVDVMFEEPLGESLDLSK